MSLKRALLLLMLLVLAAGLLPAGVLLERRLDQALVNRSREDLERASMVLEERWEAVRDVRMMHAKDLSRAPGLAEALATGDMERARVVLGRAAQGLPEEPVLVDGEGRPAGPASVVPPEELVEATRRGEMPVAIVPDTAGTGTLLLALAPVEGEGGWLGAAGGVTPVDETEAATLAGLTRSHVLILAPDGRVMAASATLAAGTADTLAAALRPLLPLEGVVRRPVGGREYLVATAPLDVGLRAGVEDPATVPGWVAFARDLDDERAVLPELRRTAAWSTALAVVFALAVGAVFATGLARPVSALADAADRFAAGDTEAPLVRSSVTEVRRVSDAFRAMRSTLASRMEELQAANLELEDRQERLGLLQAELVQRERLAATGRLMAQLAHEIRNPIASVRNCLEVVRRKGDLGPEADAFADMAVEELLRMHELAERMLDQHRPRPREGASCRVGRVAREVRMLVGASSDDGPVVTVVGDTEVEAALPADALKQVLLNLVLNAREVSEGDAPVEILVRERAEDVVVEVLDRGPGIPEEALPRIFDPFFTTKATVHGVGLGLFTAEALVRTYGGSIRASNRTDGPGARFTLELPRGGGVEATGDAGGPPGEGERSRVPAERTGAAPEPGSPSTRTGPSPSATDA